MWRHEEAFHRHPPRRAGHCRRRLPLFRPGRHGPVAGRRRCRPGTALHHAAQRVFPDGQHRRGQAVEGRGKAGRRQGSGGRALRRGADPSAIAAAPAQWRHIDGRDQQPAASADRHRQPGDEFPDEQGRRRRPLARPHQPAARHRWRRQGGHQDGVPERPLFALWHGADRRHPLCRQHQCADGLPL